MRCTTLSRMGLALAVAIAVAGIGTAEAQQTYGQLKYIPLGTNGAEYLSFGGELRERFESVQDGILGFGKFASNQYDLQRLLLDANLQYDSFRAFVQIGSHLEWGREPGAIPTDIDRLDVQQAFADYKVSTGDGSVTLRAGRAEMSFDNGAFISLRDGPNVRLAFDGVRASYQQGDGQFDVFALRPVNVSPGYFDDTDINRASLWGFHATTAATTHPALAADVFYFGNIQDVKIFGAIGSERTDTVGIRVRGAMNGYDGSVGTAIQTGSLGGKDVLAWNLHGDIGYTFRDTVWSPSITARADVLSGGGNNSGRTISTFNAIYPNYSYSTEAAIETPANLIEPGLVATMHPSTSVSLQYTLEGLWRYSANDAFYAAPFFPLVPPGHLPGRFSGMEQQIEAAWAVSEFVTLKVAYVYFAASNAIHFAGGNDEQFVMGSMTVRF